MVWATSWWNCWWIAGLIYSPADLYELTCRKIADLERMGEKSAQNLIDSIAASRQTTLGKFLFALGIREVGEATGQTLARISGRLKRLLKRIRMHC